MGRSHFLTVLLIVSAFLTFSLPQGFGRKLVETVKDEVGYFSYQIKEIAVKPREMIELMDYPDPEPNTNPKASLIPPPPPEAN